MEATNMLQVQTPTTRRTPPAAWRGYFPLHRHNSINERYELPSITGPLDRLQGTRTLVLLDVENLTISTRQAGFELLYPQLAERLASAAQSVCLHAVLSVEANDASDREHMEQSGFTVHTRNIKRLPGGRKAANADNLFAFKAGALVTRSNANLVVLGSGDGQPCDDIAQFIGTLPGKREVLTLSVAGATSSLLNARTNGHCRKHRGGT
jgi:hypothetical protein